MTNGAAGAAGAGGVGVTQTPPGTPPQGTGGQRPPTPSLGGGQGPPPPYIATHYTRQLPAAPGDIARTLDASNDAAAQRGLALTLHQFLDEGTNDLRDLNGDVAQFTALVSVTDTNMVKVILWTRYWHSSNWSGITTCK